MRLLLDTPVALWAITNDSRLNQAVRDRILEPKNTIFFSAVSVWEISIKHALGRQWMPFSGPEALHWFRVSGYEELAITADHTAAVQALPAIHSDPFDRILIAQALHEPLRLITADRTLAAYSDSVIVF